MESLKCSGPHRCRADSVTFDLHIAAFRGKLDPMDTSLANVRLAGLSRSQWTVTVGQDPAGLHQREGAHTGSFGWSDFTLITSRQTLSVSAFNKPGCCKEKPAAEQVALNWVGVCKVPGDREKFGCSRGSHDFWAWALRIVNSAWANTCCCLLLRPKHNKRFFLFFFSPPQICDTTVMHN